MTGLQVAGEIRCLGPLPCGQAGCCRHKADQSNGCGYRLQSGEGIADNYLNNDPCIIEYRSKYTQCSDIQKRRISVISYLESIALISILSLCRSLPIFRAVCFWEMRYAACPESFVFGQGKDRR